MELDVIGKKTSYIRTRSSKVYVATLTHTYSWQPKGSPCMLQIDGENIRLLNCGPPMATSPPKPHSFFSNPCQVVAAIRCGKLF